MKDEQQTVVDWMRWVMYRRNWSANQWAEKAGIVPSTITRAMRPSYDGVTTLPVIDKLARAAGVPSPMLLLNPDISESFSFRSDQEAQEISYNASEKFPIPPAVP